MQTYVNIVDLIEELSKEYLVLLAKSASIQPRMSLSKWGSNSIHFYNSFLNVHAIHSSVLGNSTNTVPYGRRKVDDSAYGSSAYPCHYPVCLDVHRGATGSNLSMLCQPSFQRKHVMPGKSYGLSADVQIPLCLTQVGDR